MRADNNISAILKSIGLPGHFDSSLSSENVRVLLRVASLNKIALLYLESIMKFCDISSLKADLFELRKRYTQTLHLTSHLSRVFERENVGYVFFKTLKPFPHTPSDVDVLLKSGDDIRRAFKALEDEGFTVIARGDYTLTMYNWLYELNVDLQLELSVSNLVYLDKRFLFQHVVEKEVDDSIVRTLDECAEIVAVSAHSFYKEHMFTLNDYYTLNLLVEDVNLDDLSELTKETNTRTAVSALFALTDVINTKTFGKDMRSSICARGEGLNNPKLVNIMQLKSLEMPYKYPKILVLLFLGDKILRDTRTRSSLPKALKASVSASQLKMFLNHFSRKSY